MNTYTKIPNYNYGISKKGEVYSFKTNKILKPNLNKAGYYQLCLYKKGNRKSFCIHQLMGITFLNYKLKGFDKVVDHIDENKENNNLSNLRVVSNRINISKGFKNKSSKYRGVTWDKSNNKWLVQCIIKDGKQKHLGRYKNEDEAGKVYIDFINNYNEHLL